MQLNNQIINGMLYKIQEYTFTYFQLLSIKHNVNHSAMAMYYTLGCRLSIAFDHIITKCYSISLYLTHSANWYYNQLKLFWRCISNKTALLSVFKWSWKNITTAFCVHAYYWQLGVSQVLLPNTKYLEGNAKHQYMIRRYKSNLETDALYDILNKRILNSNVLHLFCPKHPVAQSFWNFAQHTALSLSCFVQNFDAVG